MGEIEINSTEVDGEPYGYGGTPTITKLLII